MGDRGEAVDVDLECLGDFERRIFECSEQAGEAGFEQWGLDAGDHQGAWIPYQGVPGGWEDGWRPEDAQEILEVRNYSLHHINNHCAHRLSQTLQKGPAFITVERPLQPEEAAKRKGSKVVHLRPRKRSKTKVARG